jgi:hypothetical protein
VPPILGYRGPAFNEEVTPLTVEEIEALCECLNAG